MIRQVPMLLLAVLWLSACRPRANSEAPEAEPEPPTVEPWLVIPDDSGAAANAAPDQGVCTTGPEDMDGFDDHDNCGDPDNDGDSVRDVEDFCPNSPEDFDGVQDADGCPDAD